MFLIDLDSVLNKIADFVNSCLAFLGGDVTAESIKQWATDFCIQLLATIILFLLVRHFLWKPLTAMLEKRRNATDEQLENAKKANSEAQALKADLEAQMQQAQNEVRVIMQSAEMDAQARKEEIIEEAKAEAKRRLENADEEIKQEISNKQKEIKEMVVNTAFSAASKILEQEVDKDKYLEVVNKIIEGANK